jgi:hypothetical protein
VLVRSKMNWISIWENNHNFFYKILIDWDSWGNLSNCFLEREKTKETSLLQQHENSLLTHEPCTFDQHVINSYTTMAAFGSVVKLPPNIWNMAPCLCHILNWCFKVGWIFESKLWDAIFELLKHGAQHFHKFVKF